MFTVQPFFCFCDNSQPPPSAIDEQCQECPYYSSFCKLDVINLLRDSTGSANSVQFVAAHDRYHQVFTDGQSGCRSVEDLNDWQFLDRFNELLMACWHDETDAVKSSFALLEEELTSTEPTKLVATRTVLMTIAIERLNTPLLKHITSLTPGSPLFKQNKRAIFFAGQCNIVVKPSKWLWDFLFEHHIFKLPDHKKRLQGLTCAALEADDDIATHLLQLLGSKNLAFISLSTYEKEMKSDRSTEFKQALIRATTIYVLDDIKALELAGKDGRLDFMQTLLEHGVHINHVRDNGSMYHVDDPREGPLLRDAEGTPLHQLVESDDNILAVEFLLRHGARTWIRNETGLLPIQIAQEHQAVKCERLLLNWMLFGWAFVWAKPKGIAEPKGKWFVDKNHTHKAQQ